MIKYIIYIAPSYSNFCETGERAVDEQFPVFQSLHITNHRQHADYNSTEETNTTLGSGSAPPCTYLLPLLSSIRHKTPVGRVVFVGCPAHDERTQLLCCIPEAYLFPSMCNCYVENGMLNFGVFAPSLSGVGLGRAVYFSG